MSNNLIKVLCKTMVRDEVNKYLLTHKKYRLPTRQDIKELISKNCIIKDTWFIIDEMTKFNKEDNNFHEMFPDQTYPTICRIINNEVIFVIGSPFIKYTVVVVNKDRDGIKNN